MCLYSYCLVALVKFLSCVCVMQWNLFITGTFGECSHYTEVAFVVGYVSSCSFRATWLLGLHGLYIAVGLS